MHRTSSIGSGIGVGIYVHSHGRGAVSVSAASAMVMEMGVSVMDGVGTADGKKFCRYASYTAAASKEVEEEPVIDWNDICC
jgi:hypothetical protein